MLLSVGENDFRVPMNNTLEMYAVLQRMRVPARLLVWPDENHWILKGENSRVFYREVHDWLARWLKSGSPAVLSAVLPRAAPTPPHADRAEHDEHAGPVAGAARGPRRSAAIPSAPRMASQSWPSTSAPVCPPSSTSCSARASAT